MERAPPHRTPYEWEEEVQRMADEPRNENQEEAPAKPVQDATDPPDGARDTSRRAVEREAIEEEDRFEATDN
jgi:hypothetical protein